VVQPFSGKEMVEVHCYVHSNMICKGSICIAPLSVSFGIKGKCVHLTSSHAGKEPHYPLNRGLGGL